MEKILNQLTNDDAIAVAYYIISILHKGTVGVVVKEIETDLNSSQMKIANSILDTIDYFDDEEKLEKKIIELSKFIQYKVKQNRTSNVDTKSVNEFFNS